MKKIILCIFGMTVLFFGFSHAESGLSISGDYNTAKQTILNTVPENIKQGVSDEFSLFEKLENKDQKKESIQKILSLSVEKIQDRETLNSIIMPNICTILNNSKIESELCKTQSYLNPESESNILRISFILVGIAITAGIILFILSKINEKIKNYIIFGAAGLFVLFCIIAISDYPGFWQSAGIVIGGFGGIFIGLVIFFAYKRKQDIQKIEEERKLEELKRQEVENKNKKIGEMVKNIIKKQDKKDFNGALEECNRCIETLKDSNEYKDRYNQLIGIKSHIQEEIKIKEEIKMKAQDISKNSKEELIELISELYAIEEYEKALEICQIAIKKYPQEAILYGLLGDTFIKNNKKENALDAYENCINLDNTNNDVRINKAIILEKMEKYEEALKVADEALLLDKNYTKAYYVKALILDKLGRNTEIINLFSKGIEENIGGEDFYLVIIGELFKEKKYETCINMCNKALQISPMNEKLLIDKSSCLICIKKYKESIEITNYGLEKINPNCVGLLVNKSDALKNLDQISEALETINKAIEIDPKHANSYFNKASIVLKQRNIPEVLNLLQKTFELDPKFKEIIISEEEFKEILNLDEYKKLLQKPTA